MRKRPIKERFWEKVRKSKGCWEWIACRDKNGYGRFGFSTEKSNVLAHRFAWELLRGPLPPEFILCHKCDNPACVRIGHLFPGTLLDNAHDAMRKGRLRKNSAIYRERCPKGEAHWNSRLTLQDVRRIRKQYKPYKTTSRALAVRFGISNRTVTAILEGKRWAWFTKGNPVVKDARRKLTDNVVARIRHLHTLDVPQLKLAKRFGVWQSHISRIVNRKRRT